jgi:hypothetical protein
MQRVLLQVLLHGHTSSSKQQQAAAVASNSYLSASVAAVLCGGVSGRGRRGVLLQLLLQGTRGGKGGAACNN